MWAAFWQPTLFFQFLASHFVFVIEDGNESFCDKTRDDGANKFGHVGTRFWCLPLEVFLMRAFFRTTAFLLPIVFILVTSPSASTGTGGEDLSGAKKRRLDYTCRLESGQVVDTTDSNVAEDPGIEKTAIFFRKNQYEPIPAASLKDNKGGKESTGQVTRLKFLHEVLQGELSQATREWKPGATGTVHVTTETQLEVPKNERVIWLARVKEIPKEKRYDKEKFKQMTGSKAEEDAVFLHHPQVKGTVISVEDDEVVVTFAPVSDQPWEGPFGTSVVLDKKDYYEIEIDSQVGKLVRVGPMLGRISQVEADRFQVDYGHAFGGQTLVCDVRIDEVPDLGANKSLANDQKKRELKKKQVENQAGTDSSDIKTRVNEELETRLEAAGLSSKAINVEEPKKAPAKEDPKTVQPGDLAMVDFTATTERGELIRTTWQTVADSPETKKVDWYQAPQFFVPESVLAGEKASLPGLADTVVGLKV